ncbi:MAG: hypothetical protein U1E05_05390 [Patescibacteria group bacterium]|nr:hypothetical protein [Patescibacteria group bacterium]
MSDTTTPQEAAIAGPEYVHWRGELLAQLALSRVPSLIVYQSPAQHEYDFLVSTKTGFCFFVEVKALSSIREKIRNIDTVEELRWRVSKELVTRANESRSPVVLFLFDADTDHGRFLRLDTLPSMPTSGQLQTVRFPITNVISKDRLEEFVKELERHSEAGQGERT